MNKKRLKKRGKIINKKELFIKSILYICLNYFLIQIHAVIQLYTIQIIGKLDMEQFLWNFFIFLGAFLSFQAIFPDDYFKVKREGVSKK